MVCIILGVGNTTPPAAVRCFAFLTGRSVVVKSRTTTTAGNNWPPSRTKTAARTLNDLNDRAGKVLCRTACCDAPSNQNVARSKEVPANACGWIAKHVRRHCFNSAPKTPDGADAPIECRSRRALRGRAQPWGKCNRRAQPWGKCNRNAEPY
jgi:hypothetical protein